MDHFELVSNYKPTGDQPQAIAKLTEGILRGDANQTLLGVTGSGKTFTMANVIANVNRPTLVLAHNKTLAAQLCSEFREFFPKNAVEFFVSYYDYYQPEAYVPGKDIYIEKDSAVNDEIDKMRHSATSSLLERRDVIVVASVSCIYSIGDPEEYRNQLLSLRPGLTIGRDDVIRRLVAMQYTRSDIDFQRGRFRVHGDVLETFPANTDTDALRVEFFGDEIDRICVINAVTGEVTARLTYAPIYPASHYVTSDARREAAIQEILSELTERIAFFEKQDRFIEAQRIKERVLFDVEQLREIGFCSGVENYSRVLAGREPGSRPFTLFDFFPKDFLFLVDESHATLPQVRGMSGGDYSRKKNLVDYGFRLPSAFDNRPLKYDEFNQLRGQTIFFSATPNDYEKQLSTQVVEQIIRPTGLLDPEVEVRPTEGQIDDLAGEIRIRSARGERVLVTTLTRKMAEDLSEYFLKNDIKARYLHFDIDTMERVDILRGLREGEFDALVGVNLLREGLDLPEVSLVAILDADKEGFLRNETSLIQTIGRAARNAGGKVILYADQKTASMRAAMTETERRRSIQDAYNKEHGIVPQTVVKEIRAPIAVTLRAEAQDQSKLTKAQRQKLIDALTAEMKRAAKELDFETAAALRDRIRRLLGENGKKTGK